MILKKQYLIICMISVISKQVLISSIDYITRLALLIQVFIKSGLKYIVLDFKFQGQTYIIVYVGAISILFLFVIKKTESGRSPNIVITPKNNRNEKKMYSYKKAGLRQDKLILLGLILLYFGTETYSTKDNNIKNYFVPSYTTEFITKNDIESIGSMLYLGYPLITIIIGILLWCVLIGILRISGQ